MPTKRCDSKEMNFREINDSAGCPALPRHDVLQHGNVHGFYTALCFFNFKLYKVAFDNRFCIQCAGVDEILRACLLINNKPVPLSLVKEFNYPAFHCAVLLCQKYQSFKICGNSFLPNFLLYLRACSNVTSHCCCSFSVFNVADWM